MIGDTTFRDEMNAVYAARERDAAALEAWRLEQERELTGHEKIMMSFALGDTITVEALRVEAWRSLGSTLPAPKDGTWPKDVTPEEIWRYTNMTKTPREDDTWDAPWRQVARRQAAEDMSLRARLADLESREAALKVAEEKKVAAALPATPEEVEALDQRRVVAWFYKSIGRDSMDDLAGVSDDAFKSALRQVPKDGSWPDNRSEKDHLADLRGAPEPVVEPESPPDDTGLHRLLGVVR